ncbi:hypothetical protein [Desulfoscipio gibsoniae]
MEIKTSASFGCLTEFGHMLGSGFSYNNRGDAGRVNTLQVEIVDITTVRESEDCVQLTVIIKAMEKTRTGKVISSYWAGYQVVLIMMTIKDAIR